MKKILILILPIILVALVNAQEQNTEVKKDFTVDASETKNEAREIHILLAPRESKGTIEIENSCLILLREMKMRISLPFGKTFDLLLSAGTKFFVPKGIYKLENSDDIAVEYKLVPVEQCQE